MNNLKWILLGICVLLVVLPLVWTKGRDKRD